jgi:hypothetical protein
MYYLDKGILQSAEHLQYTWTQGHAELEPHNNSSLDEKENE